MEEEKKQKNKGDKKVILLIVLLVVVLFIARFGIFIFAMAVEYIFNPNTTIEQVDDRIEISDGKMNITNVTGTYVEDDGYYYITGYLTNNTDKQDGVSINYKLKDKDGIVLGQTFADISYLNPGETWKFKMTYTELDAKDVATFEITDVNFYNY